MDFIATRMPTVETSDSLPRSAATIPNHPVEFRPPRTSAAEPVIGVFADDLESPLRGEQPKIEQLVLGILIDLS